MIKKCCTHKRTSKNGKVHVVKSHMKRKKKRDLKRIHNWVKKA